MVARKQRLGYKVGEMAHFFDTQGKSCCFWEGRILEMSKDGTKFRGEFREFITTNVSKNYQ